MKSLKYALVVLSMAVIHSTGFAAASPLVGTWVLVKSENPMPNGTVVPYCTGAHGVIIYTEEGFVSVSINCSAVGTGNEPADISGRKFFYAGLYTFDGQTAKHKMLNASQPELIGSTFERQVTFRGPLLILTGENQGQHFSAFWRRVLPARR